PAVLHKQKQQATAVRRGGWIDVEEWSGAAKPTPDRQDPAHSIASCLRLQPKPGFRSLQLEVRFPLRVSQWSPRRALSHSSFAAFCFCFSTRRAWLPFKAQLIHLLRSQLENKQSDGAYALADSSQQQDKPYGKRTTVPEGEHPSANSLCHDQHDDHAIGPAAEPLITLKWKKP
ncbi:unnamed protein product, partial [Fusarium graminearum]